MHRSNLLSCVTTMGCLTIGLEQTWLLYAAQADRCVDLTAP